MLKVFDLPTVQPSIHTDVRYPDYRSYSSISSSQYHKLPKLDLPTFSGNLLEWQSFWDSLESAVHSNPTLRDTQKFNYLKSLLNHEALQTVAGFALTNSNYSKAIQLLHELFGQHHKITHAYMTALLEIPAPRNNLASIRQFYDKSETIIIGLEAQGLNQDTFGCLLVRVMLNKLPGESFEGA